MNHPMTSPASPETNKPDAVTSGQPAAKEAGPSATASTPNFALYIPLYLLVPVAIAACFAWAGRGLDWAAFGIGAAGWWAALLLRAPLALLAKKLPEKRAKTVIISVSGPLEELVRLFALMLIGTSSASVLSLGQGWAAIEVLFAVVNGVAIQLLLKKDDEKAQQIRAHLESTGQMTASPLWGLSERLFASAFHIGSTLLIAANPWLVIVLIPVHSAFNLISSSLAARSIPATELFVAVFGSVVLAAGLLLF